MTEQKYEDVLPVYLTIDVTDAPPGYVAPVWMLNRETGCLELLQEEYDPGWQRCGEAERKIIEEFRNRYQTMEALKQEWNKPPAFMEPKPKARPMSFLKGSRFYPGIPEPPSSKFSSHRNMK